ncbi:hypothetical protein [Methylobacterium nonmethylotrophicum]|uniref:hypothetical protein n=1 Tax=Methylobacterium nonmethylotrophicum TaxID=1141884 RepID=UPI001FDEE0FC|nr:hypothetical protein [Methylobacterium nonmethylotrophicum]
MTAGMHGTGSRLGAAILTAAVIAAGPAAAQNVAVWDPGTLPETRGTVRQYTLTPRGDVDGLILNDGTEVKLPPRMSAALVFTVRPGDAVSVRGLRARALPLIDGAAIRNEATGATLVMLGAAEQPAEETVLGGRITALLHGRRGEVNGALLDNGTALPLPPHEAARLATSLQPGQTVSLRGRVTKSALGTVVESAPSARRRTPWWRSVGPRAARPARRAAPARRPRRAGSDRSGLSQVARGAGLASCTIHPGHSATFRDLAGSRLRIGQAFLRETSR